MAFLDNSGDIILDAVLTDLGRKRMAEGEFNVKQFALGDDEIDYSLYNKNHPSGSAYYDLEILQTPVFEAFTQANANINYGLVTLGGPNANILYLPSLVLNKFPSVTTGKQLFNNVLHLCVDADTANALTGSGASPTLTIQQRCESGVPGHFVVFETGINNNGVPEGNSDNKATYLTGKGLDDSNFTLSCDGRFINAVFGMNPADRFSYPSNSEIKDVSLSADLRITGTSQAGGVVGNRIYTLPSIDNKVEKHTNGSELDVSSINGPRARALAFRLSVQPELIADKSAASPSKYSLYGKTGQSLYSISGATFDFIDTVVYLNGNTTGANTQLIVRIIRRAS